MRKSWAPGAPGAPGWRTLVSDCEAGGLATWPFKPAHSWRKDQHGSFLAQSGRRGGLCSDETATGMRPCTWLACDASLPKLHVSNSARVAKKHRDCLGPSLVLSIIWTSFVNFLSISLNLLLTVGLSQHCSPHYLYCTQPQMAQCR